jgi:hypothetical protein
VAAPAETREDNMADKTPKRPPKTKKAKPASQPPAKGS